MNQRRIILLADPCYGLGMRRVSAILCCFVTAGCGVMSSVNPSFPTSAKEARTGWRELEQGPQRFERPVLVLGGIYDPGFASSAIARNLRRATPDHAQVIAVGFPGISTFDRCADKAIDYLERRFPSDSERETIEVDVVGYSMGGLVARYAAMPGDSGRKRLKIRRLFTISTPHRGARLASLPIIIDSRVRKMQGGSDFLERLDADLAEDPYDLLCYVRLGDLTVGARNTSPKGRDPYWVPGSPLSLGHFSAAFDKRILLDIALRLRGEEPLTAADVTPIPTDEQGETP